MSVIVRRLRANKKTDKEQAREYESLIEEACDNGFMEEPTARELKLGQKLWDYMLMKHPIRKSEVIVVLGNCDVRTAEHASRLWLEGWGDWILVAGAFGKLTKVQVGAMGYQPTKSVNEYVVDKWTTPEFAVFRKVALRMGIPEQKILLEERSTNTGECIVFTYDVLKMNGISPKSITFVHQPFMERRTYATFLKQWPAETEHMQITMTSPRIKLEDYPNYDVGSLCDLISMTVGGIQRIKEYPSLGFQMAQKIPSDVSSAYKELAAKPKFSSCLVGQSKEP